MDFLPGGVRSIIEGDLDQSYALFERMQTYIPTRTVCTHCGGVDANGEPLDITCAFCDDGYTRTWVVQELEGRIADIALVTQIFVSITPGIKVGDKLLIVNEADADVLKAVRDDDEAYIAADGDYWRPESVQPSQMGRLPEFVAHLVKHTPEVTR